MKKLKHITNFNNYLFEYQKTDVDFSVKDALSTINLEENVDILNKLLNLINNRLSFLKYLKESLIIDYKYILDYYKDDDNMLMFPDEINSEKDPETLMMLKNVIKNRIEKITSPPPEKYIGYSRNKVISEIPRNPIPDMYKRGKIGFKIENFNEFTNEAKKKNVKEELMKNLKKKQREERLKSGANLKTKVVQDKRKKYNRQKEKKVEENLNN